MKAVLAFDRQRHVGATDILETEAVVEQPEERPNGGAGIVVLGLAEEQGGAALDIAQVDVVAEGGADDAAARVDRQHDLRLGIVPARHRVNADFGKMTDRGKHRRLGEDLGVGADADLEILRPHALADEQRLQGHRLLRAGLEAGEVVADDGADLLADRRRLVGGAARLLLDDALEHRDGEGDPGGLDHLQVDRRQQMGLGGVAAGAGRVGEDGGEGGDRLAGCRRAPAPAGSAVSQRSRTVGNAALMSTSSPRRRTATDGPSTSGRQTRATSVARAASSGTTKASSVRNGISRVSRLSTTPVSIARRPRLAPEIGRRGVCPNIARFSTRPRRSDGEPPESESPQL